MITNLLDTPYFTGASSTTEVPGLFPVGLDGRGYLIDFLSGAYRKQSIELVRGQSDIGNLPGEQSLNPEDLWRRSQESWHFGAGQKFLDRRVTNFFSSTDLGVGSSNSSRFNSSKGIDPWTRWQISLLPDTANKKSSTNTNLYLVAAGARLYITDGTSLVFTTDITAGTPTFTTVTGTPAPAANAITSDGFNVWTAHGASGIYATTRTTSTASSYVTGTVGGTLAYVKGRLMASNGNSIYNITAGGALPVALFTHANTDFTWVGFAEGQSAIYAAGFSGDKSLIYRIALKADATALDAPIIAGELPDGEIVRSIVGYLGFVVLGTDLGIRFCSTDGQGNLTVGSLIRSGKCSAFEPQDRFVWFGWDLFDSASSGLGRLDLSFFTQPLTPAYASDLMATTQNGVQSIATVFHGFGSTTGIGIRVFSVSALGVFAESPNKVASGRIDSGLMTYGIPDQKVGMFSDVRCEPLAGTYTVALSADRGAFTDLGTESDANSVGSTFTGNQTRARVFEIRLTLNRSASVTTTGPTVLRQTLRSYPAPDRGEIIWVPLMLHSTYVISDQERSMDVHGELDHIVSIVKDHRLVQYQEGTTSTPVFVEEYEWRPHHLTLDGLFSQGTCIVKLKSVVNASTM